MKSLYLTLVIACTTAMLFAQNPVCTFNYQGAVRDAADNILANRNIGLRLSILATPGGTALYTEDHTTLTSSLGLFDVEAGGGTKTGGTMDWMDIQWGENAFYLKTEIDINGGTNYEFLGESPVRSVPLANLSKSSLQALTASNLAKDAVVNINELNAQIIEGDMIATSNFGYYDEFNVFIPVLVIIGGKKNFWIDKIFAEDICAEGVALTDGFGNPIEVLNVNASGQAELHATNVYTQNIASNTVAVTDMQGNAHTALFVDEFGRNALSVEKVYAGEICSNNYRMTDSGGNPFTVLEVFEGMGVLSIQKINANDVCAEGMKVTNNSGATVFQINPNASPVSGYVATITGNLMVNGHFEASGTKNFLIDHPLDPENKRLRHFCIESDKLLNIYSGVVELDKNGTAWVQLPEWFEALNTDFSYQLTCIGGFANVFIDKEIKDNRFKIAGGRKNLKVSWQVNGVRHDRQAMENILPVEEYKAR